MLLNTNRKHDELWFNKFPTAVERHKVIHRCSWGEICKALEVKMEVRTLAPTMELLTGEFKTLKWACLCVWHFPRACEAVHVLIQTAWLNKGLKSKTESQNPHRNPHCFIYFTAESSAGGKGEEKGGVKCWQVPPVWRVIAANLSNSPLSLPPLLPSLLSLSFFPSLVLSFSVFFLLFVFFQCLQGAAAPPTNYSSETLALADTLNL